MDNRVFVCINVDGNIVSATGDALVNVAPSGSCPHCDCKASSDVTDRDNPRHANNTHEARMCRGCTAYFAVPKAAAHA